MGVPAKLIEKLPKDKQAFIEAFFDPEIKGHVAKTAEKLDISVATAYKYMHELRNYIVEVAEHIIVLHAPKAAYALVDGLDLDSYNSPNAVNKLMTAKDILDRVGVSKKQQLQVSGEITHGVLVLPAKKPVEIDGQFTDITGTDDPQTEDAKS